MYKQNVTMYLDVWQTLEHLCRTPNTSEWSRPSARMTYSIVASPAVTMIWLTSYSTLIIVDTTDDLATFLKP